MKDEKILILNEFMEKQWPLTNIAELFIYRKYVCRISDYFLYFKYTMAP
jgi:hypothetical protein